MSWVLANDVEGMGDLGGAKRDVQKCGFAGEIRLCSIQTEQELGWECNEL